MNLFFELIQLSLGKRDSFCLCPNEREWGELFELAKKQALVGVLFSGVERLPECQRPPKDILLKWFALTMKIEEENMKLNELSYSVQRRLKRDGFLSCVLKGQGNAQMYPQPLRRQSGDIDIWIDGSRKDVIEYALRYSKPKHFIWNHIEFPVIASTEIELHFMPTWLNNPFADRCLQKWFKNYSSFQYSNCIKLLNGKQICIPTFQFNVVYQLLHIYKHLFQEGIGLRQLMDYYFLLLSVKENSNYELRIRNYEYASLVNESSEVARGKDLQGVSLPYNLKTSKPNNLTKGIRNYEGDRHLSIMNDEGVELLKSLKLYKFAGAVMWVLGEVFGLEQDLMYVEPNEKEGRFLLDEIMIAGNFGHYDPRFGDLENESRVHKFIRKLKRNFRFIRSYPSEVLWEPVFRVRHFFWRRYVVNQEFRCVP